MKTSPYRQSIFALYSYNDTIPGSTPKKLPFWWRPYFFVGNTVSVF